MGIRVPGAGVPRLQGASEIAAAGRIAGGRYIVYPGDTTPLTNLYLTMLDKVGVPTEKLGDSTGKLKPDLKRASPATRSIPTPGGASPSPARRKPR